MEASATNIQKKNWVLENNSFMLNTFVKWDVNPPS